MRILHIVGTMNPKFGGTAEAVRLLIANAPADIASEIVTLDLPTDPWLTSLSCPAHGLGPAQPPFFKSPALIPWLRAHRGRFDGVLVHGIWTYPSYAAWKALAGRVPYVVFVHGMLDPYFKRRFPLKHAKKWLYWLAAQYWILRSAFRVLFTTSAERDLARQSFWLSTWKPIVVPLGAEPFAAATAADTEAFLQLCPGARDRRFLLFLGRIHGKKGVDLLVDAFVEHARQGAADGSLDLVMAGPDETGCKADLMAVAERAGLAHRVHWPGMVAGAAKRGAFELCEAFILPSHQENFGIAVVEALAAGRPVLISDKINIAEDVAADGCALVEPDTLDGTRHLLERWATLPAADRAAMGQRALETFRVRYNMRDNTEAILRVFESLKETA